MARLSARRRASKAKAGNGAIIAANFLSDTPRSVKADRMAARIADRAMLANATAQPPQGAVFTARVIRPWLQPKRYARFARH